MSMARPKLDDSVILEIKSARSEGLTIDQIEERMEKVREAGIVSTPKPGRGSIAKYTKEYDALPSTIRNLDQPFEWHELEAYGLPWEAGDYLLRMWVQVQEADADVQRDSGKWELGIPKSSLPTVRQVHWWWHVHLAAPDIDNLDDVWHLAWKFYVRELSRDILGLKVDFSDLTDQLAYLPWEGWPEDRSNLDRYRRAIAEKRLVPLRPNSRLLRRTPQKAATEPPWEEVRTITAIEEVEISKFPELLHSQQLALFRAKVEEPSPKERRGWHQWHENVPRIGMEEEKR